MPVEIFATYRNNAPQFVLRDEPMRLPKGAPPRSSYTPTLKKKSIWEHYGFDKDGLSPEKLEQWAERVAVVESNVEWLKSAHEPVTLAWTTLYDIMASRRNKLQGFSARNIAVNCVLLTKDDKIVLGRRTGNDPATLGSGMLGVVPSGGVKWKPKYAFNPIIDTALSELREELGSYEVTDPVVLGAYEVRDEPLPGIKFAVRMRINADFATVRRFHQASYDSYHALRIQGLPMAKIQAQMGVAKLAPDAWEHDRLIPVPNQARAIQGLLASKTQEYSMTGPARGALRLHLDY